MGTICFEFPGTEWTKLRNFQPPCTELMHPHAEASKAVFFLYKTIPKKGG